MSNIEEDIMSEEAFNELIDNFEVVETLTGYGRKAIKQNVKNLQKRIKELENKYIIHLTDEQYRKLVDTIRKEEKEKLKQKVKDKIEELKQKREKEPQGTVRDFILVEEIKFLKELLEEK